MKLTNLLNPALQAVSLLTLASGLTTATAAPVTWNGWSFDYEIGVNKAGLALKNVVYNGHTLIKKASLPLIEGNGGDCPYYQDKLDNVLTPMPWANNATLSQRQFTFEGRQWYEIGIYKKIDSKEYFQAYYLSTDGLFDAHLFIRGTHCNGFNPRSAHYRIDLDVDGPGNDRTEDYSFNGFNQFTLTPITIEHTNLNDIQPRVKDLVTNNYVIGSNSVIEFSHPDSNPTYGTSFGGISKFDFKATSLYRANEDVEWPFNTQTFLPSPYINNENINSVDVVNWFTGTIDNNNPFNYNLWEAAGVLLVPSWVTTALPDVFVSGVSYSDGKFSVGIQNKGIVSTPIGKTVGVGIYVDGVYKTWVATNSPIKPGGYAVLESTSLQRYLLPPDGDHSVTFWVDDINRFPESDETNNKSTTTLSDVGPDSAAPYVAITSPGNNSTVSGSTVILSARAYDNYAIKNVVFSLSDSQYSPGAAIVPAKRVAPYVYSWDSTTVAPGDYWLHATATDINGLVTNHDIQIKVAAPANITKPDLTITDVTYANGQFSCTVKNAGTAAIPAQALMTGGFYVDGVYRNWTSSYGPLAAGTSVNLVSKGAAYTVPAGSHAIKAHIDDQNLVMEGNESNNQFTKTISVP